MRRFGLGLALLVLVAAAVSVAPVSGGTTADPVRGGTLRIVNGDDLDFLDTADSYSPVGWALQRAWSRTLYAYRSSPNPRIAGTPYPDLAAGPPKVTGNGTIYTFTLKPNVKWGPPVNRPVVAQDFVYGLTRLFDKKTPSSGQPYALLVKGADAFAKGKAKSISGIRALNDRTLQIQLSKPAGDFLSILSLGFFAPVPKEVASKYPVGSAYSKHVVGLGPYQLESYQPGKSITFVRNPNWDPKTDPLRKAWVDRIQVTEGATAEAGTQAIIRGDQDMSLNLDPPVASLGQITTNPDLKSRFTTKPNGCVEYMPLNTNSKAGAISNLKVRQAINYALDRESLRRTRGGTLAGSVTAQILPTTQFGYKKYNLYPSPGNRGNVAKAKQLLKEAGYPNGLTLNYVGSSTGYGPAFTTAVQASLARVGIKLKIKTFQGFSVYYDSLLFPAKRMEHQIADAEWCPDYPGDGARSFFLPLFHSKSILPAANNNMAEYANPQVDKMIDRALAEPSASKRAGMWEQLDRRIMRDAPWAPWLEANQPFIWSDRLQNWTYVPWHHNADVTNVWIGR
ncbi:MAG TPA: ABC transporter substrate-binding protein [Gaiella sp.]|jgi:peptide/nickel transport system substrate-binding protein